MEDLTKHQIVLLTLLVSFITSIATGIVTVSLMEQAPTNVVQRINRVVERTVETVVPVENQNASVVTKETTVVVKEDDLVANAIAAGSKNIVRIQKEVVQEDGTVGTVFANLGVVFRSDGTIVTENSLVPAGGVYHGIFAGGTELPLTYVGSEKESELAFLTIDTDALAEGETVPNFSRPTFADLAKVSLGQSVITIGGVERDAVSNGIVSSILETEEVVPATATSATTTKNVRTAVQANVRVGTEQYGGPLYTLFGELVGVHTRTTSGEGIFLPMSKVVQVYNALSVATTTAAHAQ